MDNYIKKRNINFIIQIIFFICLIVIDQVSKAIAVKELKEQAAVTVINGFAEFRYLENSGAAFGILENAMWFFYLITAVVFIVILLLWIRINTQLKPYALSGKEFRQKTFSDMIFLGYILAALAAGAIGNLIDRLINGYVVDFIRFTFVNFPTFNFADICVTISVILLCIFFIFIYKEDPGFKIFKRDRHE